MAEDFLGTLGSIVGIGVGSVELQLVKRVFQPGDTVHGRVALKLKNKTEAKRLVAVVEGTEERTSYVSDGRGGRIRRSETVTVHRFEQELDGKRTYHQEAYDLHLPLPAKAEVALPGGTLGDVARFVTAVAQVMRNPVTWRVHVFLDIPWKANVKAHADIALG
jgi:hypothetical protein